MKTAARVFLAFAALLLVTGCSASPRVRDYGTLDPKMEREALYIIPFDSTLVPPDFGEPVFDQFIDILNARRKKTRVASFVILKEELKNVEPAWLVRQNYVSGDIWGYVESSGCCSTELKVKARIYLYEPGKNSPTFEVLAPVESFFEHDHLTLSAARAQLGSKLARELAEAVINKLTPP